MSMSSRQTKSRQPARGSWLARASLLIILVTLTSLFFAGGATAGKTAPGAGNAVLAPAQATDTPTDTPTSTETPTASATATATATSTDTATPTATGTSTQTFTPTATATATHTGTVTQTGTVTLTPTRTGTIFPSMSVTVSVSPASAKVNESLTFTIRVKNNGTAPAESSVIVDSFPTYIDVLTVTTSKGTASRTAHAATVTIGTIMPTEEITMVLFVRVNASLTRTETQANPVSLTYGNGLTATGSVNYSVVATTTLPGTGELPLEMAPAGISPFTLAWGIAMIAFLALVWSIKSRSRQASVRLFVVIISLVAMAGALVACLPEENTAAPQVVAPVVVEQPTATLLPFRPAYMFSTPEAVPPLPDFPIPSPEVVTPAQPGEPAPDTSAVVRIVVPAMNLDTVVKYVPFEEYSWYITGLREEVAWLGDTSWPGLGSNTVVAGHVTVAGLGDGPFRWLENLKEGDVITLYTDEKVYTYSVREQLVVEATDVGVTAATVNPQLTLVTCTGWDTELEVYRFRRVVVADLTRSEPWVRQGSVK